ncbi:hypothetical protein NC651_038591 [Populus alba x Populus x berolinensis]|nr:hypothetical protein NC651_038591 [Populus alba x Populus x berolinensis]
MSLLEIQDKTSKIERVNHPFPHAARISDWLFLHKLFQPRLKPSQQNSEQAKQLVIAQLMNREHIKRRGLASSSTLGYARRRRKSSSMILLGTWAWQSDWCAFVFSIVIFEERGEEIRMRRQHNLQNKIKEERRVRLSGTELRRRN